MNDVILFNDVSEKNLAPINTQIGLILLSVSQNVFLCQTFCL